MKLILYLFAFILLLAAPALGAITSVGTVGSATATAAGTTLVITTSATLEQHNIAVVRVGMDNAGASDGDNSEVVSVVDSAANTGAKICEHTYAEAGAGNGATISVWVIRAATQLTTGGTITITFANSIGARAAQAQELNINDGDTLQLAGTCQTENMNSADAGALVISGLTSKEYYFYRAAAWEQTAGGLTITTNYSIVTAANASTGVNATSISTAAERRIVTGTGETSNPTLSPTGDGASIFFALEECTPKVNCTGDAVAVRRPPIIVQ